MSARAAARLEKLGFRQVYRYEPGKADWFAAGLPREGKEAHTPRVADVARRDAPTCRIDERVGAVRDRVRAGGWDVCVVVDEHRVVLGLVRDRSEEHTSELQSHLNLVCRLLLEKKKKKHVATRLVYGP